MVKEFSLLELKYWYFVRTDICMTRQMACESIFTLFYIFCIVVYTSFEDWGVPLHSHHNVETSDSDGCSPMEPWCNKWIICSYGALIQYHLFSSVLSLGLWVTVHCAIHYLDRTWCVVYEVWEDKDRRTRREGRVKGYKNRWCSIEAQWQGFKSPSQTSYVLAKVL